MDGQRRAAYLAEMNTRAKDHGVYQHLIMCDGEGRLGDPDAITFGENLSFRAPVAVPVTWES